MNFTEGLNHRCGFLSSGGLLVRVSSGTSRRGQNATEPGKIKTRSQRRCQLPANRCVSRDCDEGNREDKPGYAKYRAPTRRFATRSYIATTDGNSRARDREARSVVRLSQFTTSLGESISKISVGYRFAVFRCIHGPRQNDICSQAASLFSSATVRTSIARAALNVMYAPSWGCGSTAVRLQWPQFVLCRIFANVEPRRRST